MKKNIKVLIMIILTVAITGCKSQQANDEHIDISKEKTSNLKIKATVKPIQVENDIWVDAKEIKNFDSSDTGWTYGESGFSSQDAVPFRDIINYLQDNDNIKVSYTSEAITKLNSGGGASGSGSGGFTLRYKGDFRQLFDIVSTQSGTFWKAYQEDGQKVVHFYLYEEDSFDVWAIHSQSNIKADQPDDTNSGFSTTTLIKTDVWKDLKLALKDMKSENGSLTFSPSTGIIFVKDIPPVVKNMRELIDKINEKITRQALIDVAVISYKSNNKLNVLADLAVAFKTANRTLDTVTGPIGKITGSGTLTSAIINPTSKFSGSSVVMEALNTTGETSVQLNRSVIALNNTSVPFVIKSTQTFLESISGGALSQGTVGATTITPGKVDSSINLFIFPRILGNGKIILQTSIKIRSIDRIRQISSGTQTIEAPDTTDLFLEQTVMMRDGQTLILSGTGVSKSGKGSAAGILGGSVSSEGDDSKLIIIITPHII